MIYDIRYMIHDMRYMIYDFSCFEFDRNPTPTVSELLPVEWKPVTATETNFLNIDFELSICQNPEKDRFEFWDKIYKNLPGIHHNVL